MIIKICGIRNITDAIFAIEQGANWIGLICHPGSKRFLPVNEMQKIAAEVRQRGAEPIAVFVDTAAEQILNVCQQTGITHVQCHGPLSRAQHHLLPENITRIYVRHVQLNGDVVADQEEGQQYLNPQRDYLLFDGVEWGSGKTYALTNLQRPTHFRFLLAGGLNANNVQQTIQQIAPHGVDVSSGVESAPGIKSQVLIRQFIATVRQIKI